MPMLAKEASHIASTQQFELAVLTILVCNSTFHFIRFNILSVNVKPDHIKC
jgi:hypothetical protein